LNTLSCTYGLSLSCRLFGEINNGATKEKIDVLLKVYDGIDIHVNLGVLGVSTRFGVRKMYENEGCFGNFGEKSPF